MFTAALPAHLTPTYIVGQDVDDVGFLAKLLFQRRELRVDLLVLSRPFFFVSLFQRLIRGVELLSERGTYEPHGND